MHKQFLITSTCRYVDMDDASSDELPLVKIRNLKYNFMLPYPNNLAAAVPKNLALPDILDDGWYSLDIHSSGAVHKVNVCI